LTVLRSPAEVRLDPNSLAPLEARNPELLAPLARGVYNGKCPSCGAAVYGVLDEAADGHPVVQIVCFGNPAHAFFFDATTGHIDNQPASMGEVPG
jgi:hypothetical protein